MGKGSGRRGSKGKGGKGLDKGAGKGPRLPKLECCVSKPRCDRCPLRMLAEGTLPAGYTVKKRKLVRLDGGEVSKKRLAEAA